MAPKLDKAALDRTARLAELTRDLAAIAGLDVGNLYSEDRMRLEHGALLQLQHEALTARVISGESVDTAELIRLNEVMLALLPPAKPHGPAALQVQFTNETLAKLTDEEIDFLEKVATKLSGEPPADIPPSPEEIALARLREENAQLRLDRQRLEEHYSGIIRGYEQARLASPIPAETPDGGTAARPSGGGRGNVIPFDPTNVQVRDPYFDRDRDVLGEVNASLAIGEVCPGIAHGPEYSGGGGW
jgi:hypothetical protein